MEEKEVKISKSVIWAKQCFFLTKIALAIALLMALATITFFTFEPNPLSDVFGMFITPALIFLVPLLIACFLGGIITLISLLVTKQRSKTPYLHATVSFLSALIIPFVLMVLTVELSPRNRQHFLMQNSQSTHNLPADANELPGDLILLFESTPGWNQVGGADDVVTDRHGDKHRGANIVFADGHFEFVKAKDIPNLHWTMEQKREAGATQ